MENVIELPHKKLIYICDTKRHLICQPYTIDNLHRMAQELGIKKVWYHPSGRTIQGHPALAHYDIPKRRYSEIRAKCICVPERELLNIIKRAQNEPPAP